MRLQRLAFSGSVFMAAAGVATTTAEGQEAGGVSRPAPFVPTLQLSGSSSSSADFRAGFDYVRGPWPDWDIALTPVFATQTKNGVTNLFALKNSGTGVANPWFLGLSISFIDLDPDIDANSPAAPQSERDVLAQVKTEVFNQCNEACRWNSKSRSDVECKSFDAWQDGRKNLEPTVAECASSCKATACDNKPDLDGCKTCMERCRELAPDFSIALAPDQMCSSGNVTYKRKYDTPHRDRRGRFPAWVISIGGGWGLGEHRYLDASPGAAGELSVYDRTKSDVRLATSATYVSTQSPFTLELAAYYRTVFDDSSTIAQWCTPQVSVRDASGGTAQVCKQLPLHAPVNSRTIWTTLLAGYANKPNGAWRMSIGPFYSFDAASSSSTIGIQAPIYLNVAQLPGFAGDFKSIVRITPTASYAFADSGTKQVGVLLELVAQRNLFPRALDWVK
jgi:hypothetical protein